MFAVIAHKPQRETWYALLVHPEDSDNIAILADEGGACLYPHPILAIMDAPLEVRVVGWCEADDLIRHAAEAKAAGHDYLCAELWHTGDGGEAKYGLPIQPATAIPERLVARR